MEPGAREVFLLQRSTTKPGKDLGKTTGWIHRTMLKLRGVEMVPGVAYQRIDDEGFHVTIGGHPRVLAVDHVVVCTGQLPNRGLVEALEGRGVRSWAVGGARDTRRLDAARAIREATELCAAL